MKIIQSATFKLTLSYLGVIMVLSIGFSLFLYQVSSSELARTARRPNPAINYYLGNDSFEQLRDQYLAEAEVRLQQNLILLNLATLLAGGAVSYGLARWTLRPVEEAMEAQGRFTADASHELRTPLTAMQTEIEVALRNPKLTRDEAKLMLESNLEEIAKLRALSEGLLKLTRPDIDMPAEPVGLDSVAKTAIDRMHKAAYQKQIDFKATLNSVKTKGDEVSLIELVVILIDNAIKYSPKGSDITIKTGLVAKHAVLTVSDHGQGIKASDQLHIFERFYRADRSRTKEQIDGYGLGLSIAQQIVDLHGGTIGVKSTLGKGSTFSVKLPV